MNHTPLATLASLVPMKSVTIWISSALPEQIIEYLDRSANQDSSPAVILVNGDVWRYDKSTILNQYFSTDPRTFFITYLGYKNYRKSENVFYLSWPVHYFTRPKNFDIKFKDLTNSPFGFSCLNNNSSFHRLILGHHLLANGMIDNMIFSQNLTNLPIGNYEVMLAQLPHWEQFRSQLPIRWPYEKQTEFAGPPENFHRIDHDAFNLALCNIATESEMESFDSNGKNVDLEIITEKSYKPLSAGQVPIFFAAKGHMAHLRSLGFEVMEDLVPTGFDQMGVFDKATAVVDIVKQGYDFISEFHASHRREITHNFELIHSLKVDQLVRENIRSFFADNL